LRIKEQETCLTLKNMMMMMMICRENETLEVHSWDELKLAGRV
jgi:hypothetical protein